MDSYRIFDLNGRVMFLRLRRGSFSGRLIVLGIFGMVVYSFVNSALDISTEVLNGESYEFSVNQILTDLSYPIICCGAWMATTIKNSLQANRLSQTDTGVLISQYESWQAFCHCVVQQRQPTLHHC